MKLKLSFFLVIFFVIHFSINAQVVNNLVVFCNEGEPFTLILDGLKENATPATNVRVTGLDLKVYQVRVVFQNTKLKDMTTTLTFYRTGKECVFALNKKGSKKHTMDYVSEKEIDGFLNNTTTNLITPTTETPTTQSFTTTETNTKTISDTTKTIETSSFQATLANIAAQPTNEGKLNAAVSSLKNNTFTIAQIKEILGLFTSEQTRLAFAKQASSQIKNSTNYSAILDLFLSDTVKQELKKIIEGK